MSRVDFCKEIPNGTQQFRTQKFELYFPGSVNETLAVRERLFGPLLNASRPGGSASDRPPLARFGCLYCCGGPDVSPVAVDHEDFYSLRKVLLLPPSVTLLSVGKHSPADNRNADFARAACPVKGNQTIVDYCKLHCVSLMTSFFLEFSGGYTALAFQERIRGACVIQVAGSTCISNRELRPRFPIGFVRFDDPIDMLAFDLGRLIKKILLRHRALMITRK